MRVINSLIFITWILAITALSVIPYSKNGIASLKLTESGMILHFVGYFVASSLCYWAFRKDTLFFILFSCFSIFLFSVVLEVVQLYLPYRTGFGTLKLTHLEDKRQPKIDPPDRDLW